MSCAFALSEGSSSEAHRFSPSAKRGKHALSRYSLMCTERIKSCAKRTSTNKATYLSLKSDLEEKFGHFLKELCMSSVLEREVQILESLRDFVVWRSTETRAGRGSRPESLSWVCEWLRGPRGGGDIPITCISAIFHLSLLFVVKEASQLWKAKSSVGSSL